MPRMPSRFFASFLRSFSLRAISFFESVSKRPSVAIASRSRSRPRLRWIVAKLVSRPPSQRSFDVEHPAALRFFGDDVLGLPLGADEEDRAAFGREAADELFGIAEQLYRLSEVDDVDAVTLAEDVFLHLRVPALRLVAEVNPASNRSFIAIAAKLCSFVAARMRTALPVTVY